MLEWVRVSGKWAKSSTNTPVFLALAGKSHERRKRGISMRNLVRGFEGYSRGVVCLFYACFCF